MSALENIIESEEAGAQPPTYTPPTPVASSSSSSTRPRTSRRAAAMPPPDPASAPAPRSGKSLSMKPDPFDGDRSKYVQWRRSVSLYLAGFEQPLQSHQKIMIVLSYMRGPNAAGRFADLYVSQRGDRLHETSWEDFAEELDHMFLSPTLRLEAERELFKLEQKKNETVSEFFMHMKQLLVESGYSCEHNVRVLIEIVRRGVRQELVHHAENTQPELIGGSDIEKWEQALIRAEWILAERAVRERDVRSRSTWPRFIDRSQRAPLAAPAVATTSASASQAASVTSIHPNQSGTFGGQGVPMDISKARAEGRCFRCGKPWPCTEHFKPRARQIRTMEFRGQTIEYTTADELAESISRVEQGFQNGA